MYQVARRAGMNSGVLWSISVRLVGLRISDFVVDLLHAGSSEIPQGRGLQLICCFEIHCGHVAHALCAKLCSSRLKRAATGHLLRAATGHLLGGEAILVGKRSYGLEPAFRYLCKAVHGHGSTITWSPRARQEDKGTGAQNTRQAKSNRTASVFCFDVCVGVWARVVVCVAQYCSLLCFYAIFVVQVPRRRRAILKFWLLAAQLGT